MENPGGNNPHGHADVVDHTQGNNIHVVEQDASDSGRTRVVPRGSRVTIYATVMTRGTHPAGTRVPGRQPAAGGESPSAGVSSGDVCRMSIRVRTGRGATAASDSGPPVASVAASATSVRRMRVR